MIRSGGNREDGPFGNRRAVLIPRILILLAQPLRGGEEESGQGYEGQQSPGTGDSQVFRHSCASRRQRSRVRLALSEQSTERPGDASNVTEDADSPKALNRANSF